MGTFHHFIVNIWKSFRLYFLSPSRPVAPVSPPPVCSLQTLSVRQLLPGGELSAGTPRRWPMSLPAFLPQLLLSADPHMWEVLTLRLTPLHPSGPIDLHCSRNYIHVDRYNFYFFLAQAILINSVCSLCP